MIRERTLEFLAAIAIERNAYVEMKDARDAYEERTSYGRYADARNKTDKLRFALDRWLSAPYDDNPETIEHAKDRIFDNRKELIACVAQSLMGSMEFAGMADDYASLLVVLREHKSKLAGKPHHLALNFEVRVAEYIINQAVEDEAKRQIGDQA